MRQLGVTAVLALCAAIAVFVVVTALDGGSSHGDQHSSTGTPYAAYFPRAPHVLSSASLYKLSKAPEPPKFVPLFASHFDAPIARYRAYSVAQLGVMEQQLPALERALAGDDRPAAEAAWRELYSRYLRLGAVYLVGPVAMLNQEIDGTAGGLPGGVSSPRFSGLHKIEYGLWSGAPPHSLLGTARRLGASVQQLRRALPSASITPLEYATRAHEILEDAQRDMLSGADVPWSGEGPLATYAGLEATTEVIATLHDLLVGEEGTVQLVNRELAALRSTMNSIAAAHGGHLPANAQLTQSQSESLDAALGGALEALSEVPGRLEVEVPPNPAPIPSSDVKIDP
jgi:high-affinity iron transporter